MFCDRVKVMLYSHNITGYAYRSEQSLPYMGPTGCTVAAAHRPICAAFVCAYHLDEDPEFRRQYTELAKACFETETPPMPREI
jgi:hypothetical protein